MGTLAAAMIVVSGCGGSDPDPAVTTEPVVSESTTTTTASTTPAGSATAITPSTPAYLPPFIDHVAWTQTEQGPSLQVFPTESGRNTQGTGDLDASWAEVVELDPTADTPGMRDQYACHWRFARIVDPDKTSWNLEPWRPVVTESEMISTRCNPGGAEESIP
ncbi:DUF2599 domain-containing protein [Williamsia muralis]|uniref:DUF2599 domain-containing protein n=1 Tax=Williamsia marianensis TaxID=85044 RepID=UPI000DE65C5D|nr:DUF2599 domain-containing protein [Williamsia marianensis]PVY28896.1 uncharacterized protein DUF2599 [Williamsia marianensis]